MVLFMRLASDMEFKALLLWASASPLAWPVTAAAAVLSMGGCSSEPHLPLAVDAYDKPIPYPNGADAAPAAAAQDTADTSVCTPDPCSPDRLDMSRRNGSRAMCIQFEKREVAGPAPHTGFSIVDINHDGLSDIHVFAVNMHHRLFVSVGGGNFIESAQKYALDVPGGVGTTHSLWQNFEGQSLPELLMFGTSGALHYKNNGSTFYGAEFLTSAGTHAAHWFKEGFLLGTENGLRVYVPAPKAYKEESQKWGLVDNGDARRFATVDIDGDNDTDIFVANETGKNRLFRNKGNGAFESAEDVYQLDKPGQAPSRDASWVVLSPQHVPRLYVSNYGAASQLFEWQPQPKFIDVAQKYGLQDGGKTIRAAWGDFLNEGTPAVFIARTHENAAEKNQQLNLLYLPVKNAAGGVVSYRDIAYPYGMSGPSMMVGAEWADANGDKMLDLVTVAYNGSVIIYLNKSNWVEVCP